MSNYRAASMYRHGTMRDHEATTRINPVYQTTMAPYVRCQPRAVPPLEEYEKWLVANPVGKRGHSTITAKKLRRAVIMRRGGQPMTDINWVVGMNIYGWLAKLPEELRP